MTDQDLSPEQQEKVADIDRQILQANGLFEKGEANYGETICLISELMKERREAIFGDAAISSMKAPFSETYVAYFRPLDIVSQGKSEVESLHSLLDAVFLTFVAHAQRGTLSEWLSGLGVIMDPKDKLRGELTMISSMGNKRLHHQCHNGSSYVVATLASPLHTMAHCPSCEREMKKIAKGIEGIGEHDVGNWFCRTCNAVKVPMEEIPVCAEIFGEVLRIFDYSDPVVLRIQAELYEECGSMVFDTLEATIDAAGFRLAASRGLEINEGVRYRFTMFPGNLRRICGIEVLGTVESG